MNLRELEYLIAVEEEHNFNRAATRCFVSQPTLSGQLKKLEQELGVTLIERNTRHVAMTDVGVEVTRQARKTLAEIKKIYEICQGYDDPMAGELNVGLIPTVAPYLLPEIIPLLKDKYPRLTLWLHEYQTHVLLDMLQNSRLDVLILALPVDTDQFAQIHLFEEPFWLAVPAGSSFSTQKKLDLAELNSQEMLLLEEGHCLRGQALDVCFVAGAKENNAFRATSLETLRYMISEGLGMTLIPALAVPKKRTKTDPVRYIPFNKPAPNRVIGMLYRKGSYREETFTQMARLISRKFSHYFT